MKPAADLDPAKIFPRYNEWLTIYKNARDCCAMADALAYFSKYPGYDLIIIKFPVNLPKFYSEIRVISWK